MYKKNFTKQQYEMIDMRENINELILNKIKKSKYQPEIKDFLKEILMIEINNLSDQDHTQLYRSKIRGYSKDYSNKQGE